MKRNILTFLILAAIWKSAKSTDQCITSLQEILVKVQELERLIKNHIPETEQLENDDEKGE